MFRLIRGLFTPARRRRERILAQPFPSAWKELLETRVPLSLRLPADLGARLRDRVQIFLAEKRFEPCGGLEAITDDIRVTIAGHACLLVVAREEYYDRLRSILVYPGAFQPGHEGQHDDLVTLGESWSTGSVVLAWDSTLGGAVNIHDGRNVALHEFSHQLDQADGASDGVPSLDTTAHYQAWASHLGAGYERLCRKVEAGTKTFLDAYGATNPAEFFAVVTETFFEKPRALRRRYPEVYREMSRYYRLDPAEWTEAS